MESGRMLRLRKKLMEGDSICVYQYLELETLRTEIPIYRKITKVRMFNGKI